MDAQPAVTKANKYVPDSIFAETLPKLNPHHVCCKSVHIGRDGQNGVFVQLHVVRVFKPENVCVKLEVQVMMVVWMIISKVKHVKMKVSTRNGHSQHHAVCHAEEVLEPDVVTAPVMVQSRKQ